MTRSFLLELVLHFLCLFPHQWAHKKFNQHWSGSFFPLTIVLLLDVIGKYTSNLRIILMSYFAPTFPFAKFGNFQHWKSCQLFVNDLTGKVTSAPTLTTSSPYLMTLEVAPSHLGCIPYYPSFLLLTFSFLVQLNVHQLHLRILLPISPSYSAAARRIDCAGLSNSTI